MFGVHAPGAVRLSIVDVMGRRVTSLVDEWKGEGQYRVRYDVQGLRSGVYLLRLRVGSGTQTRRMEGCYGTGVRC